MTTWQGIGNTCILSTDHSNPLRNQPPSRCRSQKASYSNLVPKLIAMATSLRPSISAMSSLDSLTPKTHPKIKRRVASCHTAEVISIPSLPAPPHTKGTADFWGGWRDSYHVWYERPHIASDWPYCFRFPDFHRIKEWRGSKCQFRVRKSAKSECSSPINFLGVTYVHPCRRYNISGHNLRGKHQIFADLRTQNRHSTRHSPIRENREI